MLEVTFASCAAIYCHGVETSCLRFAQLKITHLLSSFEVALFCSIFEAVYFCCHNLVMWWILKKNYMGMSSYFRCDIWDRWCLKYPDFCWLRVSIQRPGSFSLDLCWECADDFSFNDYGWFFNIFHRPFFSGLLLCIIRQSLFWLWLPFNVCLQSLVVWERLGRKEKHRTGFFWNQGCLPIDLERRWWRVFILMAVVFSEISLAAVSSVMIQMIYLLIEFQI